MREIKFRGFSVLLNRWIYGYGIKTVEGKHSLLFTDNGCYEVYQGSEGQFTGLKDERGCEIYEGDIVKREFEVGQARHHSATLGFEDYEIIDSGYFIGVVHYRPAEGWVLNKCTKYSDEGEPIRKRSGVKIHAQYAEVIGTFFENPELLDGESNAKNK